MDDPTIRPRLKPGVKPTVLPQDWTNACLSHIKANRRLDFKVDDLAHELNVTKGSFYNYFSSKDQLIDSALELWLAEENAVFEKFKDIQSKL